MQRHTLKEENKQCATNLEEVMGKALAKGRSEHEAGSWQQRGRSLWKESTTLCGGPSHRLWIFRDTNSSTRRSHESVHRCPQPRPQPLLELGQSRSTAQEQAARRACRVSPLLLRRIRTPHCMSRGFGIKTSEFWAWTTFGKEYMLFIKNTELLIWFTGWSNLKELQSVKAN